MGEMKIVVMVNVLGVCKWLLGLLLMGAKIGGVGGM